MEKRGNTNKTEQKALDEEKEVEMKKRKVVVDTNALFIPEIFGVDIFAEVERLGYTEMIVPAEVISELERLRRKMRGREKIALNVALSLLQKYASDDSRICKVRILRKCAMSSEEGHEAHAYENEATADRKSAKSKAKSSKDADEERNGKTTDDAIIAIALRENAAVLTMDEALRKRLSKIGVPTIYLRGGSRLEDA